MILIISLTCFWIGFLTTMAVASIYRDRRARMRRELRGQSGTYRPRMPYNRG